MSMFGFFYVIIRNKTQVYSCELAENTCFSLSINHDIVYMYKAVGPVP